jgi:Uma2 family endonuclease
MQNCISYEEELEVPLNLRSLEDFRKWVVSDDFPDRGRIDYLAGRIEVQWSPEDLFSHGALKSELVSVLANDSKIDDGGHLFVGGVRFSSPAADLSVEPDILFVSHAAIDEGRIWPVPKSGTADRRYVEFEGSPDLVVEIVGDGSVAKDTIRLPSIYWRAGIREFWLADAREDELVFQIHRHGETGFDRMRCDADGFQESPLLGRFYRLQRFRDVNGYWAFNLIERPLP